VVEVEVSEEGQPDYEIKWPASWDFIEWNNELDDLISESDIMVYGSLAQRSPDSKRTIQRLLGRHNGTNIFDINLRPPFNDRRLITQSLERADILKLNEDELRWLEPDKAEEEALKTILKKYDLEAIILTKGAEGATLFRNNSTVSVASENVKVKDTVGAGDAFLAGAIYGIIHNKSPEEILKFANQLGGFVASNEGATPKLNVS
jgi:fructokinase